MDIAVGRIVELNDKPAPVVTKPEKLKGAKPMVNGAEPEVSTHELAVKVNTSGVIEATKALDALAAAAKRAEEALKELGACRPPRK